MFTQSSDWHLSNQIWADRPQIFGDSFRASQQIVEFAVLQASPLLILGDLFNAKRPEPEAVACFCNQMDQLERRQIPVYVIQGQHELNRGEIIWAGVHGWPQHVHKQSFEIAGRKFYGLDWLPRGQLQEALAEIPPDTEFLVCHQVWQEFMGTMCATDGSIAEVPHVKYVLTGDLHSHRVASFTGKSGQAVTVVSCGSTHMRALNEEYPKSFYHFNGTAFCSQPIINRDFEHHEINTVEQLNEFIARQLFIQCRVPDRRPVWTIRVRMDLPEWKAQLDSVIGDRAHVFYDPYQVYDEVVEVAEGAMLTAVGTTPAQIMSSCAAAVVADNPAVLTKVQGLLSHGDKRSAGDYWKQLFQTHMA